MSGVEPEQQTRLTFPEAMDIAENATYAEIAARHSGRLRAALLWLAHPEGCPEITGALESEIHPPFRLASSARWLEFRRSILRMIEQMPDEAQLPNILNQTEAMLDWRMTVPREERFWRQG